MVTLSAAIAARAAPAEAAGLCSSLDNDRAAISHSCLTTSPAGSAATAETHFNLPVGFPASCAFCTFCITDREKLGIDPPPMPRSTHCLSTLLAQPSSLGQAFEQVMCLLRVDALSESVSPDVLDRYLFQVPGGNPPQNTTCIGVALV
jgi:hypothetical protein